MRKSRLVVLGAFVATSLGLAAGDEGPQSASAAIEPVPGQLDVVEMTAFLMLETSPFTARP